jgi:hypothetical protein
MFFILTRLDFNSYYIFYIGDYTHLAKRAKFKLLLSHTNLTLPSINNLFSVFHSEMSIAPSSTLKIYVDVFS